MHHMASYDFMEAMRNTNEWMGATAQAFASYPAFSAVPNPWLQWAAAWGQVTERSVQRMITKPDWAIESITCEDGRHHLVQVKPVVSGAFGNLIHFAFQGRKPAAR